MSSGQKAIRVIAKVLFLVSTVLTPELFGGVFSWSIAVIASLWLVTLLFTSVASFKRLTDHVCVTSLVIASVILWTGFQATPLPCPVVARISPKSALEHRIASVGFSQKCIVSRDPGSTELEIVKGIAIFSAFLTSLMFVCRGERTFVLGSIAASTTVLSLVSICHQLAVTDAVFGIYTPTEAARPVFGPLMNPNNLAGFLILGFPSIVVLGVKSSGEKRLLWFTLAAITGGALFLSLSRGGIAAFLGTALFIMVMVFYRRRGTRHRYGLALFAGGAAAFGVALGAYVVFQVVWADILQGDLSKLDIMGKLIRVIGEQPLVGIGKGAFSVVAPQYYGSTSRFVYAENIFVDWLAEWGVPVATLFILIIGLIILSRLIKSKSLSRQAAIVGIIGLVVDNMVDFGLELLGVSAIAAVVLAVAVAPLGSRSESKDHREFKWLSVRRLGFYVFASGLVLLSVFIPRTLASDVSRVQDELEQNFLAGDRIKFQDTLKRGLSAHPSEPAFTLFAAAEALRYRDRATARWLNRTMQLAPHWPAPHELAARMLLARGFRAQAFVELREAESRQQGSARALICLALKSEKNAINFIQAAPLTKEAKIQFLEDGASCLDFRSQICQSIDQALLVIEPKLAKPRIRKALLLIEEGKKAVALQLLREIALESPREMEFQITLADALLRTGAPEEALKSLKKSEKKVADRFRLVQMRAQVETQLRNDEGMRTAIEELLNFAGSDIGSVAQVLALRGRLEDQLGNTGQALRAFEESNRILPNRSVLEAVVSLARRLGDSKRVFSAMSQLCNQYPDEGDFCKTRDKMLEPVIN